MANPNTKTRPRRRWLQISLRSFLLLFTILCLWMAFQSNRARHQRKAVDALLKAGARVTYRHEWDSKGIPISNPVPPGSPWLRKLIGAEYFDTVRGVSLPETANPKTTDSTLEYIKYLYGLKGVSLIRAAVSDAGLSNLQDLTQVEGINLPNSNKEYMRRISDNGIRHVANLTKMRSLDLSHSGVTDNGLSYLQSLTNLTTLSLQNMNVTDKGLVYIGKMKNLKYLALWKTKVTDKGVANLEMLVNLEQLFLADTLVTDDCTKYFKNMMQLHNLALSGCNITDAAVPILIHLQNLRTLQLERTDVTQAGVDLLKNALPSCQIIY